MRWFPAVLLAALFVPLGSVTADPAPKILVSIHKTEGFRNGFWDSLQAGARAEALSQGINLSYLGVPREFADDPAAGQIAVIRKAVSEGLQGLVLTPADRLRLVAVVQDAVLEGIPVVCIDAPVESSLLSAIVATDNYQGGFDAARRMADRIGPAGKVVVLTHPSLQNKAIHDRLGAFLSGLREFAPGVQVLSADRAGKATVDTDMAAAAGLLRDFPGADGLYAVSGTGLVGSLRALRTAGKAGKVVLIGWDSDPETLQGLREGAVDCIVQQDSVSMGRLGVRTVLEAIRGKAPNRSIQIPATLVTRNNLGSPEIRRLLPPGSPEGPGP